MSVEACKWARMADVQKSTSKLVLLSLAQLVRYDAQDWTVFASIEYLAKVTHLNRKTVIEALARLRQLGAIQDTLMRAGENRSSVVYRLCPNAVPRIDMTTSAHQADFQPPVVGRQPGLEFDASSPHSGQASGDNTGMAADAVHPASSSEPATAPSVDVMADQDGALGASTTAAHAGTTMPVAAPVAPEAHLPPPVVPAIAAASLTEPTLLSPPNAGSAGPATSAQMQRASKHSQRRRSSSAIYGGAGASRLPAGWSLPAKWRLWTQRERPHWPAEKIDAMATTFSAYMRSRPGAAGMSEDWFESWRLWVFREWDKQSSSRKSWQSSWTGIVAKGKELGLEQSPNEPPPDFKARVFRAAGLAPPH